MMTSIKAMAVNPIHVYFIVYLFFLYQWDYYYGFIIIIMFSLQTFEIVADLNNRIIIKCIHPVNSCIEQSHQNKFVYQTNVTILFKTASAKHAYYYNNYRLFELVQIKIQVKYIITFQQLIIYFASLHYTYNPINLIHIVLKL